MIRRAGARYWHGTRSRGQMLVGRLRGPMWLAVSRGRASDFGPRLHCFELSRSVRLYDLESKAPLPLDWSIFLPRDRIIAAVRKAGYDGTILYADDSSEEIMLLYPAMALRLCSR